MKRLLLIFLTSFFLNILSYSQPVNVGYFHYNSGVSSADLKAIYEETFGVGNVTINNYSTSYNTSLATMQVNDIIVVNTFLVDLPNGLLNNLQSFYNLNKHLILSTEGSYVDGDKSVKFSAKLWNQITGENITET